MGKYAKRGSAVVSTIDNLVVLVTSDLGDFSGGDKLTKDSDIAEYFRLQMQEAHGTWHAEDEAIMAIVRSVPMPNVEGDETIEQVAETWEMSVCIALEQSNTVQGTEENVIGRVLPDVRKDDADLSPFRFGDLLAKDKGMCEAMHYAGQASIDIMKAAPKLLAALLKFMKVEVATDGFPSSWKTMLDGRPIPGTKPSEKYYADNNNTIKRGDTYLFAEWKGKAEGTGNQVVQDYWKNVVSRFPEANAYVTEGQEYGKGIPAPKKNAEGKHADLLVSTKQTMKRENEAGYNGMVRAFKAAVSAWFVMRDIALTQDFNKNIGVSFLVQETGRKDTLDNVQPIRIWNKLKPGSVDKAYTVSAFQNLDLDRALKDEKLIEKYGKGTFAALVNSTMTGEQGDTTPKGVQPIKTPEEAATYLAIVAEYFRIRNNTTDFLSAVINQRAGKGEPDAAGFSEDAQLAVIDLANTVEALLIEYNRITRPAKKGELTRLQMARDWYDGWNRNQAESLVEEALELQQTGT